MVDGISSSLAGMDAAAQRISTSAQKIANASTSPENGGEPTDLSAETVESRLSSLLFAANAKVLKSQLDMEKRVLDILA